MTGKDAGDKEKKKLRAGIMRCDLMQEVCPMTDCMDSVHNYKGMAKQFSEQGLELVAVTTCGGCPGKRAEKIADTMAQHGLDVLFLSTCLTREKMMKEFMEVDLKKVSVEEAKEMIKCVAPGVDEKSAHEAACAFCTGKIPPVCPHQVWKTVKEYINKNYPEIKVVEGTHGHEL